MTLLRSMTALALLLTTVSGCFIPVHDGDRRREWRGDRDEQTNRGDRDCVWRDGRRYCRED